MSPLAGSTRSSIRTEPPSPDRAAAAQRWPRTSLGVPARAIALLALSALGCASATRPPVAPPARPSLPAVKFVAPCDPQAKVGLTAAGVEDLQRRDAAWRAYAERLEGLLGSGQ